MKKKALVSLLSLLLAVLTLVLPGCNDSAPPADTSDTTPVETDPPAPTELVLITPEEGDYVIVRPMDGPTYEVESVKALNHAFTDKFGANWDIHLMDDFIKGLGKGETTDNENCEILVGPTNRVESQQALEGLQKGEYVIKVIRNKLIILGYDQYATYQAVQKFIDEVVNSAVDPTRFAVPLDLEITGKTELRQVPLNDQATYRYLSWNLGCSVGVAEDCVNVILRYLPDIICLQESDKKIHQNVIKALLDTYSDYEYVQTFHDHSSTYCYTPIIYDKSKFTLLDKGVEWLDGRYTGTNTKCLCWAVLKDSAGKTFGMINFHGAVCSNKYSGYENYSSAQLNEVAAAWRLDNVRQIIDVRKRIQSKYGDITVTVGGDCNFKEDSDPYKNLIADGFADAEKTARVKITTGYTTSFSYGKFYTSGKSIDHIFQRGGAVDFVVFDIVRDNDVKTGSDHCPIFVDFNLK